MLRDELKHIASTPRDLCNFGLTMAVVLLTVAAVLWWKAKPYYLNFVYPALLFALLGVAAPTCLRPLQRIWMVLAVLIGFVMNRVILGVLFFGMFTPAALILKILQKDLLHERWDKMAESYWVKRTPAPYLPQSSERMY